MSGKYEQNMFEDVIPKRSQLHKQLYLACLNGYLVDFVAVLGQSKTCDTSHYRDIFVKH